MRSIFWGKFVSVAKISTNCAVVRLTGAIPICQADNSPWSAQPRTYAHCGEFESVEVNRMNAAAHEQPCELLTAAEAAALARVTTPTVWRWHAAGVLPTARRTSGRWLLFRRVDLEQLIASRGSGHRSRRGQGGGDEAVAIGDGASGGSGRGARGRGRRAVRRTE